MVPGFEQKIFFLGGGGNSNAWGGMLKHLFDWCITPEDLCSFIIHVVTLSMLETAPNAKGDTNWKMTRIAILAASKLSLLQ